MRKSRRRYSAQTIYGVAAIVALGVFAFLIYRWLDWAFYWVWLLVVNFVTFTFFRFDKRQANFEGAMRVPEALLLALLVAGGSVGGIAGMVIRPRHKTHKALFWIVLVIATVLHLYLLYQWIAV
jgi:uncharacterized membrane protein YsdA (DUF1294 family)